MKGFWIQSIAAPPLDRRVFGPVFLLLLSAAACFKSEAELAIQDGMEAHSHQEYASAIRHFGRAIELGASSPDNYFLLGDSHWALIEANADPTGRHLSEARRAFERYVELADCQQTESVRRHATALLRLSVAYSAGGVESCATAFDYRWRWIEYQLEHLEPSTVENCWEILRPEGIIYSCPGTDPWDRRIRAMERCATVEPGNPIGYIRLANFYWDKAYRDPELATADRVRLADRGLTSIERALEVESDSWEALITKALLLRVKADNLGDAQVAEQHRAEAESLLAYASDLVNSEKAREGASEPE
jgi:hypothetical protein